MNGSAEANMAHIIPLPDTQSLLPPLLACLPTSFASSKPPPALLSLLSPILRQRLEVGTFQSSAHDSWLRLLCWDSSKAERLKEVVENSNFEPHPVSGELEVGDVERLCYKRFDAETLKAQIPLTDWDLTALYLWCTGSQEGNSWKLAELLPYDSDLSQDRSWNDSPAEANAKMPLMRQGTAQSIRTQLNGGGRSLSVPGQGLDAAEDDDDYWGQYDRSGGQTPARKASVNPQGATSEADYFAQYGNVQPAMDSYDPDEHHEEIGQSTLTGNHIQHTTNGQNHDRLESDVPAQRAMFDGLDGLDTEQDRGMEMSQPVPSSPSSRAGSDMVARLEERADAYSSSEIAIKQHISYSVKSIYRLAKGAGISRQEFEDMLQRELETLSILDRE